MNAYLQSLKLLVVGGPLSPHWIAYRLTRCCVYALRAIIADCCLTSTNERQVMWGEVGWTYTAGWAANSPAHLVFDLTTEIPQQKNDAASAGLPVGLRERAARSAPYRFTAVDGLRGEMRIGFVYRRRRALSELKRTGTLPQQLRNSSSNRS